MKRMRVNITLDPPLVDAVKSNLSHGKTFSSWVADMAIALSSSNASKNSKPFLYEAAESFAEDPLTNEFIDRIKRINENVEKIEKKYFEAKHFEAKHFEESIKDKIRINLIESRKMEEEDAIALSELVSNFIDLQISFIENEKIRKDTEKKRRLMFDSIKNDERLLENVREKI